MTKHVTMLFTAVPARSVTWYWTTYDFSSQLRKDDDDDDVGFSIFLKRKRWCDDDGEFEWSDDNFGVLSEQIGPGIFRVHATKTSKALDGCLYFSYGSECVGPITVKSKIPTSWDDRTASAVIGEHFCCAEVKPMDLSTKDVFIGPWCGSGPQLMVMSDGTYCY